VSEGWFTIMGVVVGGFIAWGVEAWRQRSNKKERARYAALRSVIALDNYVSETASALSPDPLSYNEGPDADFEKPMPFALPTDVDWSSLQPNLAYRILSIANRHEFGISAIEFINYVADNWAARVHRDEYFARLALDCAALAKELRDQFSLTHTTTNILNPDWDPVDQLSAILRTVKKEEE